MRASLRKPAFLAAVAGLALAVSYTAAAAQSCGAGYRYCATGSGHVCCPSGYGWLCTANNHCYASHAAARQACGRSTVQACRP